MSFSWLGYAREAFEPVELDLMAARAWLATQIAADGDLSDWTVYAEPPEQLAGGACIVIGPRSPYMAHGTYGELETYLVVHLLVPRAHGPAMDLVDDGLDAMRALCTTMPDVRIGPVSSVGILDEVGGSQYIVASLELDFTGGTLT